MDQLFTTTKADLINELRKRIRERNCQGYWGVNARSWAYILIRKIRNGEFS